MGLVERLKSWIQRKRDERNPSIQLEQAFRIFSERFQERNIELESEIQTFNQRQFDELGRRLQAHGELIENFRNELNAYHNAFHRQRSDPLYMLSRLLNISPSRVLFNGFAQAFSQLNVDWKIINKIRSNEFETEFSTIYCPMHLNEITPDNFDAHVASYAYHQIRNRPTMEYLEDIEFDLVSLQSISYKECITSIYYLLNVLLDPKSSTDIIRAKLGDPYIMSILQHLSYSYQNTIALRIASCGLVKISKNFQHILQPLDYATRKHSYPLFF